METLKKDFAVNPAIWVALVFILMGIFLVTAKVAAHDYNPSIKWDTSVTPITANVDTDYSSEIGVPDMISTVRQTWQ